MTKIRTLVIDDEPLARTRILNLLKREEDIDIIGECRNGQEAKVFIEQYSPDLIFLDIQMPRLDGFEVLRQMRTEESPFIIFVTAFDRYALKAFDVHAIDYLLKPYDDERFFTSLNHARKQIGQKKEATLNRKIMSLIENHEARHSEEDHIEFKHKGIQKKVKVTDIWWVQSDGNYLRIYMNDKSYYIRYTLKDFIEQNHKKGFLRIHKAIAVNTFFVHEIRYKGNNHFAIRLKNGTEVTSGRSFKELIQEYLKSKEYSV